MRELETAEADFDRVCAEHHQTRNDNAFGIIISDARQECTKADIPFNSHDPVLQEATALYHELWKFVSVPKLPNIDPQHHVDDRALNIPEGYATDNSVHAEAYKRLAMLQISLAETVSRLVAFRDTAVALSLRDERLPLVSTLGTEPRKSAPQHGEGEKLKSDATMESIPPTLLSASDIARIIKKNLKSVTSFLTRFTKKHPDCRIVNEMRRMNEPRYLYRTHEVLPALKIWMKDDTKE